MGLSPEVFKGSPCMWVKLGCPPAEEGTPCVEVQLPPALLPDLLSRAVEEGHVSAADISLGPALAPSRCQNGNCRRLLNNKANAQAFRV